MAEQRIRLVIAGREYPLEAESPEMEQLMRLAAEDVNSMLKKFDEQFPTTPFEDRLRRSSRQAHLLKTTSSSEQGPLALRKAGPLDGKPDTGRSPNLIQRLSESSADGFFIQYLRFVQVLFF